MKNKKDLKLRLRKILNDIHSLKDDIKDDVYCDVLGLETVVYKLQNIESAVGRVHNDITLKQERTYANSINMIKEFE